jgi:hypothetical protein
MVLKFLVAIIDPRNVVSHNMAINKIVTPMLNEVLQYWEFFDQLSDFQVLKIDRDPLS